MSVSEAPYRGLAVLPDVLARPVRHRALGSIPRPYVLALALVLLPPPLLIFLFKNYVAPNVMIHDFLAHALVEGFCALIALIVFYILRHEWCCSGGRRLASMAHGFLLYGIINLAHAVSPHGSHSFIFLHSMAGGALSVMLLASAIEEPSNVDPADIDPAKQRITTLIFVLVGLAIVIAGVGFSEYLPWRRIDGSFTAVANGVNVSSAVMFFITGFVLLQDFRRNGEPIVFCFALCSLAFAETHMLFPLSALGDVAWWGWHIVKLAIYLGLVFGIAYEYVQTLKDSVYRQAELRARNEELMIAYHDVAAAQESLVRAERLAALGQMAGAVAHEIRNPLATIFNCLGILKRPQLRGEERARAITLMEGSAERIGRIVEDTLGFAKAPVLRREPILLPALVDRALDMLALEARNGLTIVRRYDPQLPCIDGCPEQLTQLITNLAENAIDAMNGQGTLTLQLGLERGQCVLRVHDSGTGIPPGLQTKIFEPLFTTKPRGTGLGLAIVHHIAERHDGSVCVEQSNASGTIMTVRFPALVERASPAFLSLQP